ncbi:MAG: hypothetical protein RLZZ28_937 [Bacteroidota bacterium]|jgi:uncharacterized protein YndB with AHSA1/START domain
MNTITVQALIAAPISKVWEYWTLPEHITQWNFAADSWHCPAASNDLVKAGEFHYTMAAKDGSFSFDFWGTYDLIEKEKLLAITIGDGRKMFVDFEISATGTLVTERFEPESQNPPELQQSGWQAILDNFKKYAEENHQQA